jgi:dihydrofolate reductase
MRKIITGAFISLDGVLQAPGGPSEDPTKGFQFGGWLVPHMDEAFGAEIDGTLSGPYDLLLGRKTYEIFAAHWPYYDADDSDGGIAKTFNRITKYVCTRSGEVDTGWQGTVVLRDAAKEVAKLRQEDGPKLLTQGSGDLIQTLLAADLIDELHLFIAPVVLGRGKKLFTDAAKPAGFKMFHHAVTPNGVVCARYRREGEITVGDYGLVEPSPREKLRQERMKRED